MDGGRVLVHTRTGAQLEAGSPGQPGRNDSLRCRITSEVASLEPASARPSAGTQDSVGEPAGELSGGTSGAIRRRQQSSAGGQTVLEYWTPAEDLEDLNRHIIGAIEVVVESG